LEANGAVTMENLPAASATFLPDLSTSRDAGAAVPIARQGQERPAEFSSLHSIHIVNSMRVRGFLDLVAGQIAASITNAKAYEEERQRAKAWRNWIEPRRHFSAT